jgi:predicted TIM-barrel fold metal-dependent hydrolase
VRLVGPQGPIISNDEVASFIHRYPERFVGIAAVNLYRPLDAVRELRRCVKELGFRGLRIIPWLWNLPPTIAATIRCTPSVSTWVCRSACRSGTPDRCANRSPAGRFHTSIASRSSFPSSPSWPGHIGFPWTNEMISLATKYPNVYIDTSAYTLRRYPRELVDYMRSHGRKKVMFGSNHPAWPAKTCLEGLESLELDAETTELFLRTKPSARSPCCNE